MTDAEMLFEQWIAVDTMLTFDEWREMRESQRRVVGDCALPVGAFYFAADNGVVFEGCHFEGAHVRS